MSKVFDTTFLAIALLFLAIFVLKLGDPATVSAAAASGAAEPLPIYDGWRGGIDLLYSLGDWLMSPFVWFYGVLLQGFPFLQNDWFPSFSMAECAVYFNKLTTESPGGWGWLKPIATWMQTPQYAGLFAGSFQSLTLLGVIALFVLRAVVDHSFETVKNLLWNTYIEFTFTRRKQEQYLEAIRKEQEARDRLNEQYHSLTEQTSQLQTSVVTDEMTKVYNKRFFVEKLREELAFAKKNRTQLSLVMMDVDHFKKFNDTYGHLLGDKVLIKVAEIANGNTPEDCYCCRYGGEEFGVIMPGKDYEEAVKIADAIRLSIPQARFEEDPNIEIHISQGLCVLDFRIPELQAINAIEQIIKVSDDELYRAKQEGRNRLCARVFEYQT